MNSIFTNTSTIKTVLAIVKNSNPANSEAISKLVTVFFLNAAYNHFILSPIQRSKVIDSEKCYIYFLEEKEMLTFSFVGEEDIVVGVNLSYADEVLNSPMTSEEATELVEDLILLAK
jgi:hypothetical protein